MKRQNQKKPQTEPLSYTIHPQAVYTARLLDFKNLPEPKNADDNDGNSLRINRKKQNLTNVTRIGKDGREYPIFEDEYTLKIPEKTEEEVKNRWCCPNNANEINPHSHTSNNKINNAYLLDQITRSNEKINLSKRKKK